MSSSPLRNNGILHPPILNFNFCSRYQIHATSHHSRLPDWSLHSWSVLFYHDIEDGLSLRQEMFIWVIAWYLNRPAAWSESDVLSQHNLPPALYRCSAVAFFKSWILAISVLAAVITIYPIMADVSLLVSFYGEIGLTNAGGVSQVRVNGDLSRGFDTGCKNKNHMGVGNIS